MEINELLGDKREDILRIARRHDALNIRIFGSVVRGEARADSDVGFWVDMGPNRTPFFPGGLLADLEDLLGCKVDIVTEDTLHWYIRDRVLKELVPV